MVTVSQLLHLNIGEFEAAAEEWSGIASKLNSAKDGFTSAVADPLKGGKWKGDAGTAATKICDNIRADMDAVAIECTGVQKFLVNMASGSGDGSGNLRKHQQDLADLQREAMGKGFRLLDDGSVHWEEIRAAGPLTPEEQQHINERNAASAELEKRVKAVLKAATEVDDNLTRGLKVIFGDESTFRTEDRNRHTNDGNEADDLAELELRGAQGYLDVQGWHDASGLLDHFLDGSGDPYQIDANRLLKDVPKFQTDVNSSLGDVRKLPDGPFQTSWKNTSSPADQNLNWYWGLNNFEYRLVGEKHGSQVTYHVEVQKQYDWGQPSEHRRDLDKGGVVHFEQSQIARLNMVGKGKDYRVYGSTGTLTAP